MSRIRIVLDGHALGGPLRDGVNVYYYRLEPVSGKVLLVRRYETLPPGGNRVLAAVEVVISDDMDVPSLLEHIKQSSLVEGEHDIDGAKVRVSRPGWSPIKNSQIIQIIEAFSCLWGRDTLRNSPLIFERTFDGQDVCYQLTKESLRRVAKNVSGISPVTVRLSQAVHGLFEKVHGPFTEQVALGALPGLDWQQLAELGGYVIQEQGREVYRWPRFEDVTP